MKATGAPSSSDQPDPYRDIHDHLRRIATPLRSGPQVVGHRHQAHAVLQCVTMFSPKGCRGSPGVISSW
jgi:hypothetical protein